MRRTRVERQAELQAARDCLSTGQSMAFVGPTGVGTSTLLAHLVDTIDVERRPVVRVLATEATRTVALSPFIRYLPIDPPDDPSLLLRFVLDDICARRGIDGLLVAVDEAQHLDDSSLALLALLIDTPKVSMALAVNDDEPVTGGLGSLLDEGRITRVAVGPVRPDELATFTRSMIGTKDEALVNDVWRVAAGNLMIAREVLSQIAERGPEAVDSSVNFDEMRSPALSRLIDARLADVKPRERAVLDMVSVAGPLRFDLLEASGLQDELATIHDVRAVATVNAGPHAMVRATHPLYGSVWAAHAGEPRRRRAYGRLFAAASAAPSLADPLCVAEWQQMSGAEPDPAIAVAGARSAIGQHDGAAAERLLRSVTEHLDEDGHLLLGMALSQQGKAEEAEREFCVVTASASEVDVELASARAFNLAFGLGRVDEATAVLSAAARDVADDGQRGRLDAERGVIAGLGGDFALALEASAATLDNPAATGAERVSAYVSRSLAQTMLGQCGALAETVRQGLEITPDHRADAPYAEDQIRIMDLNATVVAGKVDDARSLGEQHLQGPGASELTAGAWLDSLVIVETIAGRLDLAHEHAREAVAATERHDPFHLTAQARGLAGLVGGLRGRSDHVDEVSELRRTQPDPRIAVWLDRARAHGVGATDPDMGALIARDGGMHALDGHHVAWGAMALHDAVRLGHASLVVDALEAAVRTTDGAELLDVMAAHARAFTDADWEELEPVANRFVGCGSPLLAAEVWAQQASTFASRGDVLNAARADAVSRLWELRCQGEPRTAPLVHRPQGLSVRELEIAIEATRGMSSADIAGRHVISVRTVDNHLGRTYRQLGFSGRDELATYLGPHVASLSDRLR